MQIFTVFISIRQTISKISETSIVGRQQKDAASIFVFCIIAKPGFEVRIQGRNFSCES